MSTHFLTRYLKGVPAYVSDSPNATAAEGCEVDPDVGKSPEELVLSNLRFVVKIAAAFRNRGVPFEDLLNEGSIGLMQAASRYDHRKSVRFTSYAAWWIRKSLRTALDEQGSTIRVPDYQRRKASRLRADDEALQAKHGHHKTDPRCGDCCPPPRYSNLHLISLDEERSDGRSGALMDSLVDHEAPDPMRVMMGREALAGLQQGMSCLSSIEKVVIEGRFGLKGEDARSLRELGDTLGLSRERIRQIEVQAKEKLRTHLNPVKVKTKRMQMA